MVNDKAINVTNISCGLANYRCSCCGKAYMQRRTGRSLKRDNYEYIILDRYNITTT